MYLDGVLVAETSEPPAMDQDIRTVRLGTWYQANQAFRGRIDELEVYTHPRTAEEIAASASRYTPPSISVR